MDDPVLQLLVRFSRRWLWLVAGATVLGGGAGAALGLAAPRVFTMRAVVSTATLADEGPVESFEIAAARVSERVAAAIRDGAVPGGTSVVARGVMGQPPNLESTHLLEVIASGPTRAAVERAIDLGTAALVEAETPAYEAELERLVRHRAAVAAEVERLEQRPVTAERHASYQKAVRELIDTTRQASTVRTYPPSVLARHAPRQAGRFDAVPWPAALGASGGLVLGYALAGLASAVGALRRQPARSRAEVSPSGHG